MSDNIKDALYVLKAQLATVETNVNLFKMRFEDKTGFDHSSNLNDREVDICCGITVLVNGISDVIDLAIYAIERVLKED